MMETEDTESLSERLFFHASSEFHLNEDECATGTSQEQYEVEQLCEEAYKQARLKFTENPLCFSLQRQKHVQFLFNGLRSLSRRMEGLDASRPWIVYWITHSISLLGVPIPIHLAQKIVSFLKTCEHAEGGYGGGPGQDAHLATTYAATMALSILGTVPAYESINREKISKFLRRMKQADGGFRCHDGGEVDIRGIYLAVSTARLINIANEKLFDKTPEWVMSCQTYEGGFSGYRGGEAHGGYTYCAVAALTLLEHQALINLQSLSRWLALKQMAFEGGFQEQTHPLYNIRIDCERNAFAHFSKLPQVMNE